MILDPILDLFRGKAITIPPMDGALKPNIQLDEAEVLRAATEPDGLAVAGGEVLFSAGNEVRRLADGEVLHRFDAAVTALAASPGGRVAAGLADGRVVLPGEAAEHAVRCPVALAFDGDGTLLVADGSARHGPGDWARDLMEKGATGSVHRLDLATGERRVLAGNLAFPYGVAVDAKAGRVIVSEAWRHRLVALPLAGGTPRPVLDELPAYPARIAPRDGGYVLALFAPRNRMIEFVLEEDDYRQDMLAEIAPQQWIAPSLYPSRSFLEPLQNGGVRSMGVHKPWSPSRSYGLVVELDEALQPVASHHSRANGQRHGITSAIAHGGRLIAASRGGDAILAFASGEGRAG
jgi:hypothetical protein